MAVKGARRISVNFKGLEKAFEDVEFDHQLREDIHIILAKFCEPYVPTDKGTLAENTTVSWQGVLYNQPYARYQYYGEVYEPAYPITRGGKGEKTIVGWYTPEGTTKVPSGREIGVPGEWMGWSFGYKSPTATHHWDERMMENDGDEFTAECGELIEKFIHARAGK